MIPYEHADGATTPQAVESADESISDHDEEESVSIDVADDPSGNPVASCDVDLEFAFTRTIIPLNDVDPSNTPVGSAEDPEPHYQRQLDQHFRPRATTEVIWDGYDDYVKYFRSG